MEGQFFRSNVYGIPTRNDPLPKLILYSNDWLFLFEFLAESASPIINPPETIRIKAGKKQQNQQIETKMMFLQDLCLTLSEARLGGTGCIVRWNTLFSPHLVSILFSCAGETSFFSRAVRSALRTDWSSTKTETLLNIFEAASPHYRRISDVRARWFMKDFLPKLETISTGATAISVTVIWSNQPHVIICN